MWVLLLSGGAHAAEVGHVIRWQDLTTLRGQTIKAATLERETVIVQFWASWCPFCAKQNPHIQALHRQSNGRFRVLTISIDRRQSDALKYLNGMRYTFDAVWLPEQRGSASATASLFGKRKGLPVVYVVRPGGKVVLKEAGEMFEEDIAALAKWAE
jgi:thiol-disulfide isomerase/thioredoxin